MSSRGTGIGSGKKPRKSKSPASSPVKSDAELEKQKAASEAAFLSLIAEEEAEQAQKAKRTQRKEEERLKQQKQREAAQFKKLEAERTRKKEAEAAELAAKEKELAKEAALELPKATENLRLLQVEIEKLKVKLAKDRECLPYISAVHPCAAAERARVRDNDKEAHGGPCAKCGKGYHYLLRRNESKRLAKQLVADLDELYHRYHKADPAGTARIAAAVLDDIAEKKRKELTELRAQRLEAEEHSENTSNFDAKIRTAEAVIEDCARKKTALEVDLASTKEAEDVDCSDLETAAGMDVETALSLYYDGRMLGVLICCDEGGGFHLLYACSGYTSIPKGWCNAVGTTTRGGVHTCVSSTEEVSTIPVQSGEGGKTDRCAAPKLLETALSKGWIPLEMAEIWFGLTKGPYSHGNLYESCTLCQKVIGTICCELNAKIAAMTKTLEARFTAPLTKMEEMEARQKAEVAKLQRQIKRGEELEAASSESGGKS